MPEPQPSPTDEPVPYGSQLTVRALAEPEGAALTVVAKNGTVNVFPAEVESALIDHPEIADVVVIGIADQEWGRRLHAVVQPVDTTRPPTAQAVIRYAKDRLAAYKVPKTVEFVDEIPRSAATRVNRSAMVQARGG